MALPARNIHPFPGDGFMEREIGDILYRVEEQYWNKSWFITGWIKVPGHEKRMAMKRQIRDVDVEDEIRELGLNVKDQMIRRHVALTLGAAVLEPQLKYRRAQLLGEDYEPATLGEKVEMDPVLVKALQVAEQEKREREEKLRIAHEKRQKEQDEMESAELWGAF